MKKLTCRCPDVVHLPPDTCPEVKEQNDYPYHVRLHPDEKCTCPPKTTVMLGHISLDEAQAISERMSASVRKMRNLLLNEVTLEDYFRECYQRGVIDHSIRAEVRDGLVTLYIHPAGVDGRPLDFSVDRDTLNPNPWCVKTCTRVDPHVGPGIDGPCNGWPCAARREAMETSQKASGSPGNAPQSDDLTSNLSSDHVSAPEAPVASQELIPICTICVRRLRQFEGDLPMNRYCPNCGVRMQCEVVNPHWVPDNPARPLRGSWGCPQPEPETSVEIPVRVAKAISLAYFDRFESTHREAFDHIAEVTGWDFIAINVDGNNYRLDFEKDNVTVTWQR